MKIVFIITDYGSFNNFLGELAMELVKENEVHVICDKVKIINFKDKFPYANLGIHFHHLHFSRNLSFISKINASIRIKQVLDIIEPDVVNLHFTSGIFLALLSGKIRFKTIGVFHGLGFPVAANPIKRFVFKSIESFCFKRLDQIGLINNLDHRLIQRKYPQASFKYNSFGVGCDLKKFDPERFSTKEKDKLKEQLNISPDDFVLMFTGRFVYFKGFDLVIKAMKYLTETKGTKNIKLILVGGPDKAHSMNLSKEEKHFLQTSPDIINIGFTGEVEKYLSIANLFIFPSFKEGMPVCIMEAIAMGVPVVTLDARGCNDIVEDNVTGKLLDIDADHINVADAVMDLYHDREELAFLSGNALAKKSAFDRKIFINESIEIFKNAVRSYPSLNGRLSFENGGPVLASGF